MLRKPTSATSILTFMIVAAIAAPLIMGGCSPDVLALLAGAAGASGVTGPIVGTGPAGPAGQPGLSAGSDLPGTVVTITDVSGSSPVQVGGPLTVTFTLKTKAGEPIDFTELSRFSIYVSGPASNYQRVIVPESAPNSVTDHGGGSITYTFAGGFPTAYAAPVNDVSSAGFSAGVLAGQPITPGTYTVGIEARRTFMVEGASLNDAGDATFDFPVGGATLAPRQIVLQDNCNVCHKQLGVHGGNRFKVTGCVLCHTNGAGDSSQTPGITIQFETLIHKLHAGAQLPRVLATAKGTDPYRYEISGFQKSISDFSDIEFPYMPGGTGFNQQTRNCATCHAGAAQVDQIYAGTNIIKANCTTCHDDMDFTSGTILDTSKPEVSGGTLTQAQLGDAAFRKTPGGTQHKFDDAACTLCHGPGLSWAIADVHVPPVLNPANAIGLQTVVQSVGNSTGSGFFKVGDKPSVTFQLLDGNNQPVKMEDVRTVVFLLSGPVENYQRILPNVSIKNTDANSVVTFTGGLAPTTGFGPFTFTSTAGIPANYAAPIGDANTFTYAAGWGNLKGRPLDGGSYTVLVYATRRFNFEGTNYTETSPPSLAAIRIVSGGTAASYPGFVSDAKCNACHGDLRFHGNTRKSVTECVLCHTAGGEGAGHDPIDFKVMIHKIHDARNLAQVIAGDKFLDNFSTGLLPTMPLGPRQCDACHATDAWMSPVERNDVSIWKVVCTSCHDTNAVAIHAQLNTLPGTISEACATCHGPGTAFAIDQVHKGL